MPDPLEQVIVPRGRVRGETSRPRLVETPLLAALRRAGTRHVYADTADVEELGELVAVGDDAIRAEIDGNTANQPLVAKIVERYLANGDARAWVSELAGDPDELPRERLMPLVYATICGRAGNDMAAAFAAGRDWEVSLQLHMGLCGHADRARWVGQLLRSMVPSAFVKVPFTPDEPGCFLVARDLEQAGCPVNFTSTFSARQAVAAAMIAGVARTNVFMGRLDDGLKAERLGEHVDLEAQRALRRLREEDGVRTQLIVASMRDWRTFERVAGCDVFTAPCGVVREFLEQDEVAPEDVVSRLETSYADELGVDGEILERLGAERIARLYEVEPEFVEFLRGLRRELPGIPDGEALFARFDRAGFGDVFHAPTHREREELERGKLPDLDGDLVERVPLDTHFSLLANADFVRHQQKIDGVVETHLERSGG